MNAQILQNRDVSYIDRLLLDGENVRCVHSSSVKHILLTDLHLWCHKQAVYQIPTAELIEWLRERIAGRVAIEIGAGRSCLGRHLGIPMTDSYMQCDPGVAAYYALMQQPTVRPSADVVRLSANEAVREYKPEVVIGAWITPPPSNMFGPDEAEIVGKCEYIHIGNHAIHGSKIIKAIAHDELYFPWLVSRAQSPLLNRIYHWRLPT